MTHELSAILFLTAAALAPLAWAVVVWRRLSYSGPQVVLYFIAWLIVRLLWRTQLPTNLQLPPGRGVVVVSNHRSSVDPFFLQMMLDRPSHWMVAKEYFAVKSLGWFLRMAEAIPTNRAGVDTAATKAAIRYAEQGDIVGMFPEGRINTTTDPLLPSRPGAVLVALRAKALILPCFIFDAPYGGTAWSPFLRAARVRVAVGRPIDVAPYADRPDVDEVLPQLTLEVLQEIAKLGGSRDFKPTLAGRKWKS